MGLIQGGEELGARGLKRRTAGSVEQGRSTGVVGLKRGEHPLGVQRGDGHGGRGHLRSIDRAEDRVLGDEYGAAALVGAGHWADFGVDLALPFETGAHGQVVDFHRSDGWAAIHPSIAQAL